MRKVCLLFLSLLFLSFPCSAKVAHLKIAGVTAEGRGVIADLYVEMREGSGRVFVYTMPLTMLDVQASARLAKEVACEVLQRDCSIYDFFYIIHSDYSIIGGPSAGAAMTIATLALLAEVELDEGIAITGTINPDASIGPVGAIYEKAKACAKANLKLFLVPKGGARIVVKGEEIDLTKVGGQLVGIEVREVSFIEEAFELFTGYKIEEEVVNLTPLIQEHKQAMRGLAEELIRESWKKYEEARSYAGMEEEVKRAFQSAKRAEELSERGEFYSAASFAVRSLLSSFHVLNIQKLKETAYKEEWILNRIDELEREIEEIEKRIEGALLDEIRDVEALLIAIARTREAEEKLESAREKALGLNYTGSAYELAYAKVRIITAKGWLSLLQLFRGNESIEFEEERLKELAKQKIDEAKATLAYARVLAINPLIATSEQMLSEAEEEFAERGYVHALFKALQGRALANLAIVLKEATVEEVERKIEEFEAYAEESIARVEKRGLIPILALSYLEFAKAVEEPVERAALLFYSREFAKLAIEVHESLGARAPEVRTELKRAEEPMEAAIFLAIFALGFLIGFAFKSIRMEEKKGKKRVRRRKV